MGRLKPDPLDPYSRWHPTLWRICLSKGHYDLELVFTRHCFWQASRQITSDTWATGCSWQIARQTAGEIHIKFRVDRGQLVDLAAICRQFAAELKNSNPRVLLTAEPTKCSWVDKWQLSWQSALEPAHYSWAELAHAIGLSWHIAAELTDWSRADRS